MQGVSQGEKCVEAVPHSEQERKVAFFKRTKIFGVISSLFKTKEGGTIDWEALIGGSWPNVIGIVVFVVGMALLAQHSVRQFGPIGKISTGVVTSVTLLVLGIWLETAESYRLLAWTLVGGGWALLYFTAYAAYNIEASKIINNPSRSTWNPGAQVQRLDRRRRQGPSRRRSPAALREGELASSTQWATRSCMGCRKNRWTTSTIERMRISRRLPSITVLVDLTCPRRRWHR
jgi:hypothetical protein